MAAVCREFGISRKTGYKIFYRYKDIGIEGLQDRSRTPYRYANRLPFQVEKTILSLKQEYPDWGAPKIRDKLLKAFPMIRPPAQIPFMPSWTETAWQSAADVDAIKPPAQL